MAATRLPSGENAETQCRQRSASSIPLATPVCSRAAPRRRGPMSRNDPSRRSNNVRSPRGDSHRPTMFASTRSPRQVQSPTRKQRRGSLTTTNAWESRVKTILRSLVWRGMLAATLQSLASRTTIRSSFTATASHLPSGLNAARPISSIGAGCTSGSGNWTERNLCRSELNRMTCLSWTLASSWPSSVAAKVVALGVRSGPNSASNGSRGTRGPSYRY
jgi:hypothetical protein